MLKKNFPIDSHIYSQESVLYAIQEFSDFFITFEHGVLTIEDEDSQYVFDEFMNYILSFILESY